ncbi:MULTISPECIES: SIR2 family protein [Gammaproteobacteria]|uniref:SIR2 family protein n=1 Tax=Gammaproteobacteria TaxID=1236 RepID=UPI003A8E8C8A
MQWPQNLIREVARRRCVLFLGAGVSASAEADEQNRPKTWGEFLSEAVALVPDGSHKEEVISLIEARNYLLSLQAIFQYADQGDYQALLRASFNNPAHRPGELHKLLHRLDSRIVITTNFDKIYENYCESTASNQAGYSTISYYDESLGDLIRTDERIIIKAHGTINNIPRMIFSRAQYHAAKRDHARFYTILQSLLLTNTCIFIGCGMDDPDINLLLEDVKIASSSSCPHYALIRSTEQGSIKARDWVETYNIKPLQYGREYTDLNAAIQELVEEVEELRAYSPEA